MYWCRTTAGRKHCKTKAVSKRQGSRKRVRDGKKRWRRCKMWRCNTAVFTHRFTQKRFYTQTPLHTQTPLPTDAFTHRRFYTQTLLHTDAFHTEAFTHRRFYNRLRYTQTLFYAFYTDACTHRRLCTQMLFTQTLLHTDAFITGSVTHRCLYTFYTDAFTHRRLRTQMLFTQTPFYTQMPLHTSLHTDVLHRCFYTQHSRGKMTYCNSGWLNPSACNAPVEYRLRTGFKINA